MLVEWVSYLKCLHTLHQLVAQLVLLRLVDEDALGTEADLAAVGHA